MTTLPLVDLRSDTVTRPTAAMRAAMAAAEVGDDVFGDDPNVNAVQARIAALLGKEAALYVPSGTQSNLIAIMSHCGRGDEYIVGQMAHAYRWEGGGAAVLGSVQPQPLEHGPDGTLALDAIEAAIKPDDAHFARSRLLCLENTIGGKVLPMHYVAAATALARRRGLATHLDGARLFNAAVAIACGDAAPGLGAGSGSGKSSISAKGNGVVNAGASAVVGVNARASIVVGAKAGASTVVGTNANAAASANAAAKADPAAKADAAASVGEDGAPTAPPAALADPEDRRDALAVARSIADHFDSVSVCFSKGLGAPVGSALVGSRMFIKQAHRWRKMLGGGMRQAGVVAAAAHHALDHHVHRLADDHALARRLAAGLGAIAGVTVEPPQSNIVFADIRGARAAGLVEHLRERGVLAIGLYRLRFVTHLDVDAAGIDRAVAAVREHLAA